MNYKRLLAKYIDHVSSCEGISFISEWHMVGAGFTQEEEVALIELDKLTMQFGFDPEEIKDEE